MIASQDRVDISLRPSVVNEKKRFGEIRQYIPKGTDFSELTDEMLAEIEWKLNHRPRKSLGYRTPLEYCKQLFNFDF